MECEELRQWTTEKQKLDYDLSTLMDTVWSPFRLKAGFLYPGKCSDHSTTEWKRNSTISFPDSCFVFLNRLFYVLLWQEDLWLRMPIWHQYLSKARMSLGGGGGEGKI